jgi:CspA family cold shock protein
MPTGKVKWFDTTKRYGFITPDDGGPDVFLHLSDVAEPARPAIQPDMRLQYSLERKGDKISARDVTPAPVDKVARSVPGSGTCAEPDFNDDFEKEWGLRRG